MCVLTVSVVWLLATSGEATANDGRRQIQGPQLLSLIFVISAHWILLAKYLVFEVISTGDEYVVRR